MAKSLRSKVKRKHRNVKRERNKPKELARLKKILPKKDPLDSNMREIANVVDMAGIKAGNLYNPRTKVDTDGKYPKWMTQRDIKKIKKTLKIEHVNRPKNVKKKDVHKRHKTSW